MSNNTLESMFSDFIDNNMIGLSDSATKELFTCWSWSLDLFYVEV